MKNIIKTFSLLTLMAVIPGAFAATSRVSMISKVSPRLPSIAAYLSANTSTTSTSGTISYMADIDCVNNYTECIKGADACGSDFSECPTNIALHAKMPNCLSVLAQCSSSGIASLFGTSSLAAITTPIKNDYGDITGYTYPSAGSALEQMVTASALANRLSKDQCVKKYTSCLHKDSVCGEDFELCTDPTEFKNQALSCDSVLARCQNDGKTELFGSTENANALKAADGTRVAEMIASGAQLAAVNTVSTCYKVADQCIMNACSKNPTRCLEDKLKELVSFGDSIAEGKATAKPTETITYETTSASDVKNFIKSACLDTIGTNKYCYATVAAENSGSNLKFSSEKIKSYTHLSEEEIEDVFENLYDARMRENLKKSIQDLADKFDAKAKNACVDTISTCAMRSCGGGVGSVCYSKSLKPSTEAAAFGILTGVFKDVNASNSGINIKRNFTEIQSACSAIVNTDPNCLYAASDSNSVYTYNYIDKDAFKTLFGESADDDRDPIGVVASLNSLLATSYNQAAIEDMKKQCRTVALSCVNAMCGKDFVNCYRNRTDVVAGTYNTDNKKGFDISMNKVGGVLDYNIVIGLCLDTVQNSSVCEEHLKIAVSQGESLKKLTGNTWGKKADSSTTVRSTWLDANAVKDKSSYYGKVLVGCKADSSQTAAFSLLSNLNTDSYDDSYDCSGTLPPVNGSCSGVADGKCVYSEPVYMGETEYVMKSAAETLFQELLADVEMKVQQLYNSKLTKEQNMCNASYVGGVRGANDNGSTFMWVKLNSNKIPKNYAMKGLSTKHFKETGDLYGAFCRARITVTSDDRAIQEALGDKATAYFAVGDAFTCGSWIDNSTLEKITKVVGEKARKDAGEGSVREKIAYAWGTVAPLLGGGLIGTALTESGLISKALIKGNQNNMLSQENADRWAQQCKQAAGDAVDKAQEITTNTTKEDYNEIAKIVNAYAANAYRACSQMGVTAREGCQSYTIQSSISKDGVDEKLKARIQSFIGNMTGMQNSCNDYVVDGAENGKSIRAARIAIPIATAVGSAALGAGITASVLQAKYEDAENEAVAAWMEEVGDHIQCYLGGDELGSYGDVISIEID